MGLSESKENCCEELGVHDEFMNNISKLTNKKMDEFIRFMDN